MNWLDIVLTIILVVSVIGGLRSGLIRAAFSLAGIILGVVLAGRLYLPLADKLAFILQGGIAKVVAFLLILCAVIAIAQVLSSVLSKAASAAVLGWLNHIGGGAFGLIMGSLVCGALLATWVKFFGMNSPIAESTIAPILLNRLPVVLSLLPQEFDSIRQFFGNTRIQ